MPAFPSQELQLVHKTILGAGTVTEGREKREERGERKDPLKAI